MTNEELQNVVGGGKWIYGIFIGIGSLLALAVGIVDGLFTLKWKNSICP